MRIERMLLVVLWVCSFTLPCGAQTQDIQKLNDELARLEKEMGEIKQQIAAMGQAQKPQGAPAAQEPETPPSAPMTFAC